MAPVRSLYTETRPSLLTGTYLCGPIDEPLSIHTAVRIIHPRRSRLAFDADVRDSNLIGLQGFHSVPLQGNERRQHADCLRTPPGVSADTVVTFPLPRETGRAHISHATGESQRLHADGEHFSVRR